MPKAKPLSVQKLKKKADAIFSEYIRKRDEEKGCITCGVKKEWKYQQNGHYVSRSYNSLRYDERNCNAQCVGCNVFKRGAMDSYALQLIRRYGANILSALARDKRKTKQWTVKELQTLIEAYKIKITNLNQNVW